MGFLDKLLGGGQQQPQQPQQPYNQQGYGQPIPGQQPYGQGQGVPRQLTPDEQAVARYRYMLQSAPPDQIEQAHKEAFERLTPEQRRLALQQLSQITPQNEQQSLNDDPQNLARAATRAEMRQPGVLQQTFGGMGGGGLGGGMMGGMGMGLAGGLLTSLAGGFIGSSIANSFFSHSQNEQGFNETVNNYYGDGSGDASNSDAPNADYASYDNSADQPGPTSDDDPLGDPGLQGNDMNAAYSDPGPTSNDDAWGDPGATDAGFDSGGFDSGGFDSGGFDSGGFDSGGDFGGGDF